MSVEALFNEYRRWYQEEYLTELVGEDEDAEEALEEMREEGWHDPVAGLTPLSDDEIDAVEMRVGPVPPEYRCVLRDLGVGSILCALDEEPTEHEILHPDRFDEERANYSSWLSPEGVARIKKDFDVDPGKLIPWLKPDGTTWVLLALDTEREPRVFVFDHDFEGGYDKLLCGPKTMSSFLESYFRRSRLKNPLNGFNCWEEPGPD